MNALLKAALATFVIMAANVMWIGFYQVPDKTIPISDHVWGATSIGMLTILGKAGCNSESGCQIAIKKGLIYPIRGMALKHEYCHVLQWQQNRTVEEWECYMMMWSPI